MPDMLVNLLKLSDERPDIERLRGEGITVRRIRSYELSHLRRFIIENFGEGWADEASVGLKSIPSTCFIAVKDKKIVGFAAYECTARDYFGPTGVTPNMRGKGVGKALLMACLHAMREMGYVYAVIGGAGPVDFYAGCCGATVIPDSVPGFYADGLE